MVLPYAKETTDKILVLPKYPIIAMFLQDITNIATPFRTQNYFHMFQIGWVKDKQEKYRKLFLQ